ncbi:transcriptional regulator, LacI family [Rathayibacter oskolensis]|uniref:Transcriptional regulator, LacI family n=1 Tax=Rathayibacter oskolensis TaxID=1891671 RepID=A0A1X7NKH5_9MICO|nr:substrate-binding domain-containing protein [Rathayibacter oskolensis]SMH38387.1 transcriptional regulator, LacI family [Rathayibacter oskolensis]
MADSGATLAQIAEAAGVSIPTVSRVLNGKPGISPLKRNEIEQLIEDLGYARRKTKRTASLIDFVVSSLETQWATELLRGAQAEAARAGVDMVLNVTHSTPAGAPDWIDRIASRGSDGIVLVVSEWTPDARKRLAKLKLPVVAIDPLGNDTESFATVSATDWVGGREATEHLLALGHRRIGFVTGPMELECHQDRLDGYMSALGRADVAPQKDLVRHGDSLISGGQRYGGELLDLPDRPTAIISGSDEQAYGVYLAARDRGIRIPEDLSVVGFDDVDLCRWVSPQLTTVRQPLASMASEATRLLLKLAAGEAVDTPTVRLASALIVRESTAPIAS